MLKKILVLAVILTSNFVFAATSEAAQTDCDSENYCDEYDDGNCNGGYCKYNRERSCR